MEGPKVPSEARRREAPRGVGSGEISTLKSPIFGPHKLDTPPKNSLPGCTGDGIVTLIPQTQMLVSYMKFRKIITAISKNSNFRRRYMLI